MRIALVTTSYPRSADDPSGHFVQSEVVRWVNAGHHVRVFAPGPRTRVHPGNPALHWLHAGEAFGWPGVFVRLKSAPWRALPLASFLWAVRRALQTHDYDELVLHWLLPVAPWVLPRGCRVPTTVVVHGSDARLLTAMPKRIAQRLLQTLLARGMRFRFVSEQLQSELSSICPRLHEQSWVEPAALDVPKIASVGLRQRLGLAPGAFVAVIVGRLVSGKRVEVALERARVPQGTQWVVVGDGPLFAALQARFPEVRFTGAVPRTSALEWIAASDVLVSASLHEGAPTAIREARALGTPVWTPAVADVQSWAAHDSGITLCPELG